MRVLANLEPKDIFYYFEEICNIPHGSGNTDQISSYLEQFAIRRGLEHYRDTLGNIIIIKEASDGYENHEPVILQGHMDMVAVKKPDCAIDMKTEGLRLAVEGDKLFAVGTSLGGDDGIAVAYGLALLDGNYKHPRIELVITVDEEVGMDGARALDVTPLRAKRMINLDSEEEGIFLTGCAGGARVDMELSGKKETVQGLLCKVQILGLMGGHSGAEIHKERGNGICLLGRVLRRISEKADFCIKEIKAGVADNAIPVSAEAELLFPGLESGDRTIKIMQDSLSIQEITALLKQCAEVLTLELQGELADKDPGVRVEVDVLQIEDGKVLSGADSKRCIAFLGVLPYGVQAMSFAVPGLVETSLNPGLLSMEDARVKVGISVRSSVESAKKALIDKLQNLSDLSGAKMEVYGEYPGWTYRKDSPLRDKMREVYIELYGKEPSVEAIHAGVECGLLIHKIPGLDCVSIGPDMKNIHTTEEELCISSAIRVWDYLIKLLECL